MMIGDWYAEITMEISKTFLVTLAQIAISLAVLVQARLELVRLVCLWRTCV